MPKPLPEQDGQIIETPWRTAFRGRCYVYCFPCRDRDVAKIGFSTDPIARMQSLHPRFFEFFDLERGALIETEYVRDARVLESRLKTKFRGLGIPAPLMVKEAAGGRTEWLSGAYADAMAEFERSRREDGFTLHANLAAWMRTRLTEHVGAIFDWSTRQLQIIELLHFNANPDFRRRHEGALRSTLALLEALDFEVEALVPDAVAYWYRWGFSDR